MSLGHNNLEHFHPRWRCFAVLSAALILGCDANDRKSSGAPELRPGERSETDSPRSNTIAAGHRKMISLLADIQKRTSDDHPYIGDGKARRIRESLDALPAEAPALDRSRLLYLLADAELKLGRELLAIEHYEQARQLFSSAKDTVRPDVAAGMLIEIDFSLGVAYLRLAETQNCCQRNTPESCILPIRGGGIHIDRLGSTQAAEYFLRVLRGTTPKMPQHMNARWLLNVAHMTLGTYPEKVPKQYLIPPRAFDSDEPFPRFINISRQLGVGTFSLAGGVVADDFDGDGYLDLLVSSWDTAGQIRFFRNNADGTFSDHTKQAGLEGILGGLNMVQADYDNDGRLDVLVLRGAWLAEKGRHPNSLLRNTAGARGPVFSDVTFEAGLGEAHYPTQTASWADYDNDGDLDLFVGNEAPPSGKRKAPCQLFRNNGDGTFTDVAPAAGVTNDRFAKAVVWGDYDGDDRPDIYVSNFEGANRLYHNSGDGTFRDVAQTLGVAEPRESFPAWFWDFDNDGHLDLYVSAYGATIAELAAAHSGLPVTIPRARLYRGNGRGAFEDVTS